MTKRWLTGLNYEPLNFQVQTITETQELAEQLAKKVTAGAVLTLSGELGVGKTTFTKSFAAGLGITRIVNSPTFTMIKEYIDGRLPLYHMDVYRLEDSDEDLGFAEYFTGEGVCVVEWAEHIRAFLPAERLDIMITYVSESKRLIQCQPLTEEYFKMCKELADERISD